MQSGQCGRRGQHDGQARLAAVSRSVVSVVVVVNVMVKLAGLLSQCHVQWSVSVVVVVNTMVKLA